MDRFDAMQAFARVVETGSFTRAADALHISRTTATQLVQQLEARLRVSLLHRTTRKVGLTPAGSIYYERVVQLLADLDRAEADLPQALGTPAGRLRVDVPGPLASMVLVPALPAFFERYPGIELHMGAGDRMADLLDESIDCVVRGGPVTDQSLIARHVGDLQMSVYAAPSYLTRKGMPAHPGQLAGPEHSLVGFLWEYRNLPQPYALRRGNECIPVRGHYALALNDGNAYLAAGLAGLGVVLLPDYMARQAVSEDRLQRLFEGWHVDPMPIHVAFHRTRHSNARLRAFIDWVVELMASLR